MKLQLPKYLTNFYLLFSAVFIVWMLFFDANDLINQYWLLQKQDALVNEKKFYESKIEEVKKDRAELLGKPDQLQKFAREKYLMRKPTEDVFIIKNDQ